MEKNTDATQKIIRKKEPGVLNWRALEIPFQNVSNLLKLQISGFLTHRIENILETIDNHISSLDILHH